MNLSGNKIVGCEAVIENLQRVCTAADGMYWPPSRERGAAARVRSSCGGPCLQRLPVLYPSALPPPPYALGGQGNPLISRRAAAFYPLPWHRATRLLAFAFARAPGCAVSIHYLVHTYATHSPGAKYSYSYRSATCPAVQGECSSVPRSILLALVCVTGCTAL